MAVIAHAGLHKAMGHQVVAALRADGLSHSMQVYKTGGSFKKLARGVVVAATIGTVAAAYMAGKGGVGAGINIKFKRFLPVPALRAGIAAFKASIGLQSVTVHFVG